MKTTSASFNTQKDSWENRPFYNIELDGEIWGITGENSTSTNIYLAQSASPNDADYYNHTLEIGGVSKPITSYTGSTRLAGVGSAFSGDVTKVLYKVKNTFYFTSSEKNITLNSIYLKRGMKIGRISENSTGRIDAPDITMDNHDNLMTIYCNAYWGFRNMNLRVYTMFKDLISSNPEDYLFNKYTIRNPVFDEEAGIMAFKVENAVFRAIDMPYKGRRFLREGCYWKYRDVNTCKYTGANVPGANGEDDYCSKVFHGKFGCKFGLTINGTQRKNTRNYGGAPAIPDKRTVIFIPTKGL